MVTVHEEAPGAALLERLVPGTRLTAVVMGGDDPKAVEVLVEVVSLLHASPCRLEGIPCARDLGRGFESYLASQDERLPRDLIARARERWDTLCDTQRTPRLLHGDLQHENVLLDRRRGWTAIDPKGVVAELEFELGPALRNPPDRPDLYGRTSEVERRLDVIGRHLAVDIGRVVDWAWSQALLSAVWTIEDGGDPAPSDPALLLAATLEPMLS
jgi:streptomycin 6-kinase